MNILITGANGFVGKNLTALLRNIKDGKDKTHPHVCIEDLYLYDVDTPVEILSTACQRADFVFNLAGVNRPQNVEDFSKGNCGFASDLLNMLKIYKNTCPIMLSSSIQAALIGRYADSEYGKSKAEGEKLFFDYAEETGVKVLVYRFPNLFGKWCRPNYNSAVATFCYNIARGLPISVSDPNIILELLYIDDLLDEMVAALENREHHCEYDGVEAFLRDSGRYCTVPITHKVSLGEVVRLLESFRDQPSTLLMQEIPQGSFAKKLFSTYLSYLPKEKVSRILKMNIDNRGSFTELLRTKNCGQFSVNVSKPGITKGQHWHHSKWEIFVVVSGRALIQQRRLESDEVLSYEVSGERLEAIYMLPGYTHSITNLSDTEDLITFMWANECFDQDRPDTFHEMVK